ncbi:MAG: hypothetical protein KJP07_16580 [Desulfatitalea sp.]|nr:hypothetical protein [Desulfatitalea sp.]
MKIAANLFIQSTYQNEEAALTDALAVTAVIPSVILRIFAKTIFHFVHPGFRLPFCDPLSPQKLQNSLLGDRFGHHRWLCSAKIYRLISPKKWKCIT